MRKLVRLAVAGLLASAQLLAAAHLGMVGHRTCLEHGEAIHAPAPSLVRTPGRQSFAVINAGLAPGGHEHEHCLSLAHGRDRLMLIAPAVDDFATDPAQGAICLGRAARPGSTVDLLALAPKGSPPST